MAPTAKEILVFMTKLPFSQKTYTRIEGNKSRYVQKGISYLFNVWSIIDIFMVQPPPQPFYVSEPPTFILIDIGYQDYVPVHFFL